MHHMEAQNHKPHGQGEWIFRFPFKSAESESNQDKFIITHLLLSSFMRLPTTYLLFFLSVMAKGHIPGFGYHLFGVFSPLGLITSGMGLEQKLWYGLLLLYQSILAFTCFQFTEKIAKAMICSLFILL